MKYTITARCIEYLTLEVEADSLEEAKEIADEADGGEFTSDLFPEWKTYCIEDENGNVQFYA